MATIMAVSAVLHSTDTNVLDASLKSTTGGSADFFDGEFVVIDVGQLQDLASHVNWPAVIMLFRKYNLNPVAVRNAPVELAAVIAAHGLSIDQVATTSTPLEQRLDEPDEEPLPVAMPSARAMIVDTPVRGGQRLYAKDCDMIVTAVVNSGAEIIADGSIFMYAPLRGRALAGAKGDSTARIFTTCMEAELISIAGMYRTFENGMPADIKGKAVEVVLHDEKLDIFPIATSRL